MFARGDGDAPPDSPTIDHIITTIPTTRQFTNSPPPQPPKHIHPTAVKTAFDVDAKMIVVLTESGTTARLIAKYRPSMPVLALTAIPETARFTQVGFWGVGLGIMPGVLDCISLSV